MFFMAKENLPTYHTLSFVEKALGILLAFSALNAFGGGFYGMFGAEGIPVEWLEGSPFRNYIIPGMVLFFVIGGAFTFAAIAVFARLRIARKATITAIALVLFWLSVQVAIIGYVSWMQPFTAVIALVMLGLALLLPKPKP
jgi:hypothetical protein